MPGEKTSCYDAVSVVLRIVTGAVIMFTQHFAAFHAKVGKGPRSSVQVRNAPFVSPRAARSFAARQSANNARIP